MSSVRKRDIALRLNDCCKDKAITLQEYLLKSRFEQNIALHFKVKLFKKIIKILDQYQTQKELLTRKCGKGQAGEAFEKYARILKLSGRIVRNNQPAQSRQNFESKK